MTHVIIVDDTPNSPTEGLEIGVPVTVVETPAMKIAALRAYGKTSYGKRIVLETWARSIGGDLAKLRPLPKEAAQDAGSVDGADEIRVLMHTSPAAVSGIPKKVPELMEVPVGGDDMNAAYTYAYDLLGKEIDAVNVFKEGMLIDVTAVTKGKGVQGPVKRWGVTIQDRKAFRGGKGRHIGNLGQMGYQQRTEYNKRILKIGSDGAAVTPAGGFIRYGEVKGAYVLLHGSIPGPFKRLIRMRHASRPKKTAHAIPQLSYISLQSKQGVR
jgi:large subunit ribosomal protein L3